MKVELKLTIYLRTRQALRTDDHLRLRTNFLKQKSSSPPVEIYSTLSIDKSQRSLVVFSIVRMTQIVLQVVNLVSAWAHLSRVIVKQYRNGVAIRLITTPRTTTAADDISLLHQEIAFLIHINLLNDLMAFIEGYSQLESSSFPLSIERISHINKSPSSATNKSRLIDSSNENQIESSYRSPFVQRILSNRKNHRTYTLTQEKQTSSTSPSLFELTRQFFTRNPAKTIDIDERETVSNVPNRTTLVTWRSIADAQASAPPSPPPPPVLYRTIINVKHTGR